MRIHTGLGVVEGVTRGDCAVFRGIPYAERPVGRLRFARPVPVRPWQDVFKANAFGPPCMQAGSPRGTFYGEEFFQDASCLRGMGEDCLYLNIWTPADALSGAPLPVAVWIHGGGFANGYSHEIEFDGEPYARRGVILVTIGYRLNVFGFLAHPALARENADGACGNMGIWDQLCALQWVRDHIGAFGGDPARVTVMGQSAGARSVQALLASPLAQGLMRGAVIQSSYAGTDASTDPVPLERAMRHGEAFVSFCGMDALDDLRTLADAELFARYTAFQQEGGGFSFCGDGTLVPPSLSTAFRTGAFADIPAMIGTTAHEGERIWGEGADVGEAWYQKSLDWARAHARTQTAPCYVYRFTRQLPGDDAGAFHSAELWYMFGTLARSWRPFRAADTALSDAMLDAWCAFIATGNPSTPSLAWRPFTRSEEAVLPLDAQPLC